MVRSARQLMFAAMSGPEPIAPPIDDGERRDRSAAMWRGWCGRCPRCGEPTLFRAYLKMASGCASCGEDFEPFRADDAPAYFTIFLIGHIIVPLVLMVERSWMPSLWVHALLWIPASILLSLLVLPRIKGATIGLLWALRFKPR
jgi:uncharacterized protein (DUF983 family)